MCGQYYRKTLLTLILPSLHLKHQKELKNENEIRNKLFGIISLDIKNSCLAEVMYGKKGHIK